MAPSSPTCSATPSPGTCRSPTRSASWWRAADRQAPCNSGEWASRELRGYAGTDAELPDYRKPGAVLQVDALRGNYQITGQQISPRMLPDVVQEYVGEVITLGQRAGRGAYRPLRPQVAGSPVGARRGARAVTDGNGSAHRELFARC